MDDRPTASRENQTNAALNEVSKLNPTYCLAQRSFQWPTASSKFQPRAPRAVSATVTFVRDLRLPERPHCLHSVSPETGRIRNAPRGRGQIKSAANLARLALPTWYDACLARTPLRSIQRNVTVDRSIARQIGRRAFVEMQTCTF
jgi:hypothetical protein